MLNIDNKFEIGQEVYVIQKCRMKDECPACKGEGHIIVDGNRFSCVTCYGTGRLHGQKKVYQVVGKDIIDKIKTYSYRLHNGTDGIKTVVKYAFRNGTDYTDVKLFLTEEEAIAECDRLNKTKELEESDEY